jgi:hypothetical protein
MDNIFCLMLSILKIGVNKKRGAGVREKKLRVVIDAEIRIEFGSRLALSSSSSSQECGPARRTRFCVGQGRGGWPILVAFFATRVVL